jgi:hypothetical protein
MNRKMLVTTLVAFFAIAWMSASSLAAFAPRNRERVWVPCEFGYEGLCQLGNPEYCPFIMCQ